MINKWETDLFMRKISCYPRFSADVSLEEVAANAGSQFGPGFAGLFIRMIRSDISSHCRHEG